MPNQRAGEPDELYAAVPVQELIEIQRQGFRGDIRDDADDRARQPLLTAGFADNAGFHFDRIGAGGSSQLLFVFGSGHDAIDEQKTSGCGTSVEERLSQGVVFIGFDHDSSQGEGWIEGSRKSAREHIGDLMERLEGEERAPCILGAHAGDDDAAWRRGREKPAERPGFGFQGKKNQGIGT